MDLAHHPEPLGLRQLLLEKERELQALRDDHSQVSQKLWAVAE
jgi:hypothetical protein